jgi:ABC-type amino acid transport substrate-binding protein/ABC-type amino acid transport system permease subunit
VNRLACALALLLLAPAAWGQDSRSPDAALEQLLTEARADCARTADRLSKVLCGGRIRIGVRDFYPLFATREGETRSGYEVDVAHAIARRLGVDVDFTRVNAASRIPLIADDRIDLVIATMGHNTQRDSQVRFIRPHYYQSETTVVGPKSLPIKGWNDLAGRTICATIGNGSNAEIVSHNVRLMLFDEAGVLPDRLRDETCLLAAQDDSFFAEYFTDLAFAAAFDQKFGFAQVPWGMAVARTGSDKLARALDLMSQIFHRDGVFLDLAHKERIGTAFLEKQHAIWQRPECNTDTGSSNPACVLPALDAELKPTPFAARVLAFEEWTERRLGIDVTLPMLTIAPAFTLFLNGVVNSLILIAGALVATVLFACAFGAALGSSSRLLHWSARVVTVVLQSSPIVLTLVIAAALAHAIFPYSDSVAIGASIVALGLMNGSNAGQAISEAMASLRSERHLSGSNLFLHSLGRSATQIVAFLVNAAKGTPIASFIGAPELLSALTDITSFSSGRVTTYCLLLVFYTVVVMGVVWLCNRLRSFLEHNEATA